MSTAGAGSPSAEKELALIVWGIGDKMEEIRRLAAESLAAETLLVALLSRFDDHDASIRATINEAFDHATRFLEDRTFDASESAGPEELAHSLRVIEELRVATLGPREESKQENSLGPSLLATQTATRV